MPEKDLETRVPESLRFDHRGHCWWCGNPANSREHKYKRSDVVREFGSGPWPGKKALLRVSEDGGFPRRVTGPNSSLLKFEKTLCASCNNQRSQGFDYAYEKLAAYISSNDRSIIRNGSFKLSDVFGTDWPSSRDEVVRYFIKHAACRMADDRIAIPGHLIAYLDKKIHSPHGFSLNLGIRIDYAAMEDHLMKVHGIPGGALWLGAHYVQWNSQRIQNTRSHVGFGALRAIYEIDFTAKKYITNLKRNRVKLSLDYNIHPDEVAGYCLECFPVDEGRPDSLRNPE